MRSSFVPAPFWGALVRILSTTTTPSIGRSDHSDCRPTLRAQFKLNRSTPVFSHLKWDRVVPIARLFAPWRLSLIWLTCFLLGAISATAQNPSKTVRSPEAIALMQRVLAASGGTVSSETIHDLVATGTVSAPMNSKETLEARVTIFMRGLDQLRIDSELPKGMRSVFYNRGRLSRKETDGSVFPLGNEDAFSSTSHLFPLGHLAAALSDTSYSVTTPETIADDESGHNLYHLRLQRIPPGTDSPAHPPIPSVVLDYYVDATTNCIVRVRNPYSDRGATGSIDRGPFETYRFGDYRLDNGILLPHQITVSIDKRLISTMNISAYQLNTGLADDNFTPVARQ